MQNNKLKAAPIATALVVDNENDCLRLVKVASSLEGSLAETVPTYMRHAVLIDGIHDMRIMAYEFPNLHSAPIPNEKHYQRYYRDLLMPAVTGLGIKPKAKLHVQEIVFAIQHGIPLALNKPKHCIRQRTDYAEHCRSYRDGYLDLIGKGTVVVLPSGEKIGCGLKSAALHKFEASSVIRHEVSSGSVKTRKCGIE